MSRRISPPAGQPAPKSMLADVRKLLAACIDLQPDPSLPAQRIVDAAIA